ncbi:MAG TPA: DNA-binding protein [Hyphomonas sp.]|jgi:hypothetical protein|uniref:helix-turn-helix domain-containing protein n=1 Tax=uncultured Hyphomonas sp. TaxID=225298 RepID=UPI000C4AFD5B|nr:hypothetical protein [Hyphomonas sp.]MAN91705.1 hypothetical protein [Hyphomonadaceae bacterium]HBL93040.1 DNA-binding protein [Hyphomonas sp.]HCJ18871.1 DNA-binding protein [Hyphomonas sp.]
MSNTADDDDENGKPKPRKTLRPRLPSPFLTTDEAARFLRLERRTLDNWRWAGLGPPFRKHGGKVVYHETDLVRFSERGGDASAV